MCLWIFDWCFGPQNTNPNPTLNPLPLNRILQTNTNTFTATNIQERKLKWIWNEICFLSIHIPKKISGHIIQHTFKNENTNIYIIFFSTCSLSMFASSLYFPTKIGFTVPNCQKLCIRLVVGTSSFIGKTKSRLHDRKT